MKFIKEHLLWVVKFMDMAVRLGRAILPLAYVCVCSTEGVKEFDGIVYCIGVVTFLGDSGVKRAEITDCSSRMDPQLDKIYQCFCCSILARRDL